MKKNGILSKLLIVILIASFLYVFFVSGIIDLANRKDIHKITINQAYDILEVENSINGLIPIGKDYYYVGISENNAYLIHADKSWLNNNFDSEGNALASREYSIKALAKRAKDYDVEKELAYRISQIEGITSALGSGNVLELNYVRDAVMRIAAGIVLLILIIAGMIFHKKPDTVPAPVRKAYFVLVVAGLILALITIV